MIIASLGKLSAAQDLVAGSTASTNQMKDAAIIGTGIADVWLVIDVETVNDGNAGTSTTHKFVLRVATSIALTTFKDVIGVTLGNGSDGDADERLFTAGKHILVANVGKQLIQTIKEFRSENSLADTDFVYIGIMSILADGNGDANISINAALSPTEPQTESDRMKTVSGVGVPVIGSAGSGA